MTTFILEHRTPRQVRFLPASMVKGRGAGGFSYKQLRREEATLAHGQVMSALSNTMRGKPVASGLLKAAFDEAVSLYPGLMAEATYSPKQADGRPAMVIVKG